ncbi:hypothetical protein ACHWQZ_G016692 [Mnemiopsis leidyi]
MVLRLLDRQNDDCTVFESPRQEEKSCKFHFDTTHTYGLTDIDLPAYINNKDLEWFCRLNDATSICNGVSECLTDECGCHDSQVDVFYCADGSGCIAWSGLCDDTQDCLDGSDECFCFGHVVIPASEVGSKVCMSEHSFCLTKAYLGLGNMSEVMEMKYCEATINVPTRIKTPVERCLFEAFEEYRSLFEFFPYSRLHDYCRENCSYVSKFDDGWTKFCTNMGIGLTDYDYYCDGGFTESYHISQLCDGQVDCSNHADEIGCPLPERFYCEPNLTSEWVSTEKVCDNMKDCTNGADECGTCQFEVLSSSEFLIQSKIIIAVTSMMGILIIILNTKEGYRCWVTKCSRKSKAIDRILLMQIFAYDALMGVYLLSIVIAALFLKFKGDYCILEKKWRASSFCATLGTIFSFSSHGSLLAIASVSITRFITCQSIVADLKKRAVMVGCVIVTVMNFVHSVVPLIPITAIKDVFRTGLYLTNISINPFFDKNPLNMTRLDDLYEGMLHRERTDTYKMIDDLKNATTKREIFDLFEISYYGNTGLCIHNIFKEQKLFRAYQVTYCIVLLVALIVVTTAYVKILLKQRETMMAVNPNAANSNAQDSNSTTLTVKIALMIGSQLICWISFIFTVMYFQFFSSKPASPMVFEAFALVVIPINSFLNPVFYSELYKKIKDLIREKWRQMINYLSPIEVPN